MFFFVNDRKQDKPWGKEVIKKMKMASLVII